MAPTKMESQSPARNHSHSFRKHISQQQSRRGATMAEAAATTIPRSKNNAALAHQRRVGLVVVSALYTLLFVGAIFGWGPMQLMLEREGVFHDRCVDGEEESTTITTTGVEQGICPAQTSALLQISLVAQLTQFVSPLLGYIIDRYSARTLAYAMIVFHTAGLCLVILALSTRWHNLLYLGFSLIAVHTFMGGMLLTNIGLLFKARTRVRIISLLNALFDAAGISYLGLWAVDKVWKDLTMLMVVYFEISVVLYAIAFFYWTVASPVSEDDVTAADDCIVSSHSAGDLTQQEKGASHANVGVVDLEESTNPADEEAAYIPIALRSPMLQLSSTPYWALIAFFALHIVSTQWNASTIRDFLAELGDDIIYTILNPVSLLGLPFVDYVVERYGYHGGFQIINLLAFGYNLVKITSTDLNVQIVGFVLFSFYRCFLFSVTFSFLPTFLSFSVVGKATGIIFFIVAILSVLNIPLAAWAVEGLDSFFLPNLIWTILVLPCIYSAWYLGKFIAWEKRCSRLQKERQLAS